MAKLPGRPREVPFGRVLRVLRAAGNVPDGSFEAQ